jgi:hypothetical protein
VKSHHQCCLCFGAHTINKRAGWYPSSSQPQHSSIVSSGQTQRATCCIRAESWLHRTTGCGSRIIGCALGDPSCSKVFTSGGELDAIRGGLHVHKAQEASKHGQHIRAWVGSMWSAPALPSTTSRLPGWHISCIPPSLGDNFKTCTSLADHLPFKQGVMLGA